MRKILLLLVIIFLSSCMVDTQSKNMQDLNNDIDALHREAISDRAVSKDIPLMFEKTLVRMDKNSEYELFYAVYIDDPGHKKLILKLEDCKSLDDNCVVHPEFQEVMDANSGKVTFYNMKLRSTQKGVNILSFLLRDQSGREITRKYMEVEVI